MNTAPRTRHPSRSSTLLVLPLALSACSNQDFDLYTKVNDNIPSLVEVYWETDVAGTSYVEYGTEEDYGMTTQVEETPTRVHDFTLLGLPFQSDVYIRAVTIIRGVEYSATEQVETGGLPSYLPDWNVTVLEQDKLSDEPYLMGASTGTAPTLFVIDREGQWLWFKMLVDGYVTMEVQFKNGSNRMLYNETDTEHEEGFLKKTSFTNKVDETIPTPGSHHFFDQLGQGAVAYISTDVRDWYDEDEGKTVSVVGDAIKIVYPDESEDTLFSTWDWAEPIKSDQWDSGYYTQGYDWTHMNSIHYDEASDTLTVAMRNLNAVLKIDATSGEVLETYLGKDLVLLDEESKKSSSVDPGGAADFNYHGYQEVEPYRVAEGSIAFKHPHDASWTAEGHLLLISTDEETIAVEYALDPETRTMEQVWSEGEGEGFFAISLGLARDLSNGNRLVNWGTAGLLREVTLEGETVWEVQANMGNIFGETFLFSDFYAGI